MKVHGGPAMIARWCCETFKTRFEAAGDRDFAVIVEPFLDGFAFALQYRALEPDDPGPIDHPRPISTIGEVHIHFCPWCGRSVQESYGATLSEMVRPGLA